MGKNKNRDRKQQQQARAAESSEEQAKNTSMEAQDRQQTLAQGSPRDVARKHQRRFGHN